MEAALLILDAIGILLVIYWNARNEIGGPGRPTVGLFRFIGTPAPSADRRPGPRPLETPARR